METVQEHLTELITFAVTALIALIKRKIDLKKIKAQEKDDYFKK